MNHCVRILTVLALAVMAAGCAHRRINHPLVSRNSTDGYYFHNYGRTNQSDDMFVALAFSGGGTRAAAFAYGVLEEMRDTRVPGRESRSLLDEVDMISSVSGGSVTAAAYCLYGDRVFGLLEAAFLKRNVQRTLVLQTLNPLRWPALWSSSYGRSELAADYYDRILFHGATFGVLRTNGSPYLIINGTDITTGSRFDFTQHTFDLIGSDLTSYPIAGAVAASSAVPGALTPITLANHAARTTGAIPEWIGIALHRDVGRISRRAAALASYLDSTNRPFIHLVDGGVSDNAGIRPMIDYALTVPLSPKRQSELAKMRARKIVLIIVNAYASPDRHWDLLEKPPGSVSTAAAAASLTLDQRTLDTVDYLKETMQMLREQMRLPDDVKIYPVFLSFTNFRDQKQQRFYLNLPTSFFLPGTQVDKLRQAGRELLRADPAYQQLLRDLGVIGTDPDSAK